MTYRDTIGNQKSSRRNSNNIEDRQSFLNTAGEGTPSNNEGFNGQETVRYIKDKGVYHFIKRGGKWHSRLFKDTVLTAQEEVSTTVTVDTSDLEYDSLTVSAGTGLTGGGSVSLGGSTTIDANVDGTSVEISADTIQLKDGGVSTAKIADSAVTEAKISSSAAGDGIQGGSGSALAVDVSDFIGLGLLDDGNENIDVLFDGGYEGFDLSGSDEHLITSGGDTFVVTDETSTTTISPDATAASGSLNEAARSDHTHQITTAVANTIQPDDSASEGTATSFSRSDHAHAIVTDTPVNVDLGSNSEGTSTSFARADHKHDLDESIAPTWTSLHTHNNDIKMNTGKKVYWVDSNQSITGDATSITIDGDDNVNLEADAKIEFKSYDIDIAGGLESRTRINNYNVLLNGGAIYKKYPFSVRPADYATRTNHYTSGEDDYKQNYSMIGLYSEVTTSDGSYGSW